VLDFVGVLFGVSIDARHASTLRSAGSTTLCGVDIVMKTVQGTADNVCRNALCDDLDVVELVDLTGTERVVAEGAQSPGQRTFALLQD
jgi:hypothetical protein